MHCDVKSLKSSITDTKTLQSKPCKVTLEKKATSTHSFTRRSYSDGCVKQEVTYLTDQTLQVTLLVRLKPTILSSRFDAYATFLLNLCNHDALSQHWGQQWFLSISYSSSELAHFCVFRELNACKSVNMENKNEEKILVRHSQLAS